MAMVAIAGFAHNTETITTSVVGPTDWFTDTQIRQADVLHIAADTGGQTMRYWYDGTDPTDTEGIQFLAGAWLMVRGIRNIRNFKVRTISGTATVQMQLGTFGTV